MKNPWEGKTPEQHQAMLDKGAATKKRNKALKEEAARRVRTRQNEVDALERRIEELSQQIHLIEVGGELTKQHIHSAKDIVAASIPPHDLCGVYFLIRGEQVYYVGQSVCIFARIAAHQSQKKFTRFAWVRCERALLDKLESLYIHLLQPEGNGNTGIEGGKNAPLSIAQVLNGC